MEAKKPAAADVQVGNNIRQQRLRRSVSQEALAAKIGVTFQQVQKYERGTNRVSASRLVEIAAVFGVTVDTLFAGTAAEADPNAEPAFAMSKEAISLANDFEAIGDPNVRLSIRGLVRSLCRQQVADAA
ncbi:UNVERIFIED_ORG: helix-turn-helix domain-containing protein [Roseateles sp. XES5]|nr:helix-turn-helix transcriptional regulator [Roseateles sp. XES5]